jgi:hypothetical protein
MLTVHLNVCVMKPKWCTIYLQFIQSLYLYMFQGLLTAHHQDVTMYICNNWSVLYVLVGMEPVNEDIQHIPIVAYIHWQLRPASWYSGQSFWLLIMRSQVQFPVQPWEFFLEGEDSHGDHGLGSLLELSFKAPPGTSYSYITIHLIGTM